MKIAQIYGKGLDGCGVTKVGVEISKYCKKNKIICDIFSFDYRIYARRNSHEINIISIKTEKDIIQMNTRLKEYDIIIYQSYPINKFNIKFINNFFDNIVKPNFKNIKIGFMHELNKVNINRIPNLVEIMNSMDFVYTFNTDTWFAKELSNILPSKEIGKRINKFTMFLDFEQFSSYRKNAKKLIETGKKEIAIRYVGRWSIMKHPARLFDIYPKIIKQYPDIFIEMFGIEKSIGAKIDIFDNKYCSNQYRLTKKIGEYIDKKIQLDNIGVNVFGPYKHTDALRLLSNTLFGASFYNHASHKEPYGDRMEYTQIEIIGAGALPLFDIHWAENNKTINGQKYIDIEDFAICSDRHNLDDTIKQISELIEDKDKQMRMFENSYDIIKNEFDINKIFPDMLKHCKTIGPDKDKFENTKKLISGIFKNPRAVNEYLTEIEKHENRASNLTVKNCSNKMLSYLNDKNEKIDLKKYKPQSLFLDDIF